MNELQVFDYNNKMVRTVEQKGTLWWVLKDVCKILKITKYRDLASRLDEDERGLFELDTLGGKQKSIIINESGLYNVILRSDKPEAKPFRKWVTSEILPSIRKTGSYSINESAEQQGALIDILKGALQTQQQITALTNLISSALHQSYKPVRSI